MKQSVPPSATATDPLFYRTDRRATGTPSQIVQYAYDFGNRWVRKVLDADGDGVADASTIFVHDDGQIVLDFAHTGPGDAAAADLAHRYLWGPAVDQLLGQETVDDGGSEDVLWALTDHLNSVRDLAQYDGATDTTTIARHLVYDAFGNLTSDTAPAVPSLFLYTARPFDQHTGLQNNLHRWYDAVVGRWLSEDPIGFAAGDGNLYRYVGNGPLGAVDPEGLQYPGYPLKPSGNPLASSATEPVPWPDPKKDPPWETGKYERRPGLAGAAERAWKGRPYHKSHLKNLVPQER